MIKRRKYRASDEPNVACTLGGGRQEDERTWIVSPIGSKIVLDDFYSGVAQAVSQFAQLQRFSKIDLARLILGTTGGEKVQPAPNTRDIHSRTTIRPPLEVTHDT